MTTVLQHLTSVFRKPSTPKTDTANLAKGVTQVPSGERRAPVSGGFHPIPRSVRSLSPTVRLGRVVKEQLDATMDRLKSGDAAGASAVGTKVKPAMNALHAKSGDASIANYKRFAKRLDQEVHAMSDKDLASFKHHLSQVTSTDWVFTHLTNTAALATFERKLAAAGLADEKAWAGNSTALDHMASQQLEQLKELGELSRQLMDHFVKPSTPDSTLLPGSSFTWSTYSKISARGKQAHHALLNAATLRVSDAVTKGCDGMNVTQLKALKADIDRLMPHPPFPLTQGSIDTLLKDMDTRFQALQKGRVEKLLGKGDFDAKALKPLDLAKLAHALAREKDKPEALGKAEKAVHAAIAQHKQDAMTAFQASFRALLRGSHKSIALDKLKLFLASAKAVDDLFAALSDPNARRVRETWMKGVLQYELGLGELGAGNVRALLELWDAADMEAFGEGLRSTRDPAVGHLSDLWNVLNGLHPVGNTFQVEKP